MDMGLDLNEGEKVLRNWSLFYIPPTGGGKYNWKLTVTNERLLYDAKFDASLLGVLGGVAVKGGLRINKSDIASVDGEKKAA